MGEHLCEKLKKESVRIEEGLDHHSSVILIKKRWT